MGKRQFNKKKIAERYQRRQAHRQPQAEGRDTYLDKYGYLRFRDTEGLVHREVAYRKYKMNPSIYKLPFGAYEIHHIDGCKTNNRMNNLALVTADQHNAIHHRK